MLVIRRNNNQKKLEISALIFRHENATTKTKDGRKVGRISFLPHFYFTLPKIHFRGARRNYFPRDWSKNEVEMKFHQLFIFITISFAFSARDFFPTVVSCSIFLSFFFSTPRVVIQSSKCRRKNVIRTNIYQFTAQQFWWNVKLI